MALESAASSLLPEARRDSGESSTAAAAATTGGKAEGGGGGRFRGRSGRLSTFERGQLPSGDTDADVGEGAGGSAAGMTCETGRGGGRGRELRMVVSMVSRGRSCGGRWATMVTTGRGRESVGTGGAGVGRDLREDDGKGSGRECLRGGTVALPRRCSAAS
jgi:hypothetical protein